MQRRRSFHFVFLLFSLAMFCAATTITSPAQVLTTLASFNGTNGSNPLAPLIQGTDGNFYGTTTSGGTNNGGTVFRITPNGKLTTLYSFCAQVDCTDGSTPDAGLVQGNDGNFYGTTESGGVLNCYLGCGTVFKITPQGTLTTLYKFCSQANCADGGSPYAGLAWGTDGNFYGTTTGGGAKGGGTVFKVTPDGALTTLYSFCTQPECTDGVSPFPELVLGADGNFYGITSFGGTNYGGAGTVFKITPSGALTTLYNFCAQSGCADGRLPYAGLVQGTDGNFYGTTEGGGVGNCILGCGTVFGITPQGALTTLHSFDVTDGAYPVVGLVQGTDGNFYGVTPSGGTINNYCQLGCGTIFNITPGGMLTTLHSFNGTDGGGPQSMVQATDGNFYGTTSGGGDNNYGTVFKLSVGIVLSPVQFVPVKPCRLVDTRLKNGGGGPIQGGTYQAFVLPQLAQSKGCDDLSTAATYSLNVTAVPQGPLGYLTVWPAGKNQPSVSTLNSVDGRMKANAAIVPAGASAAVSVFVSNTSDVVLDIDGYFAPISNSTLAFYTLPPCRVADTRQSKGYPQGLGAPYLTGGMQRDLPVLSSPCFNGVSSPAAYSFNFTVVPHVPLGYLTVWPAGQSKPGVSTLNALTGTTVANAAIVPAGTMPVGDIDVFASNDTDLVVDVNGYFALPTQGNSGLSLFPVVPCRVLDTRHSGNGQPFSGELTVDVVGSVCGPSSLAQAYVFNATVVPSGQLGYLTLWPDCMGCQQPGVSTLNAVDGAVTSNMAIVPNGDGSTDAFASNLTQLIMDISSYFAP